MPPRPPGLDYLWRIHGRLASRAGSNGFSANPITYPDMEAFMRLSGIRLTPFDVEMIEDLDTVRRAALADASRKQDEGDDG